MDAGFWERGLRALSDLENSEKYPALVVLCAAGSFAPQETGSYAVGEDFLFNALVQAHESTDANSQDTGFRRHFEDEDDDGTSDK